MTTEEKLEKAIEFIRSIEKMDTKNYEEFDLDDLANSADGECLECCSDDVEIHLHWPNNANASKKWIDSKAIDDLKEKAWHVLADLTW